MKPNRPDPASLKKLLNGVSRRRSQIAESLEQERSLKAEYEAWMSNTDPTDTDRIALITPRKTQLDLHPAYRQRLARELSEHVAALAAATDEFRSALVRAFHQKLEGRTAEIAEALRAYFKGGKVHAGDTIDRAVALARQSDDCMALSSVIAEAEQIQWSDQPRDNSPERYDERLIEAATALLALAERN